MLTKVQKWGNSQGLRISKTLLADAQLAIGDDVDISLKDGVIVVVPAHKKRGYHNLKELVSRIPASYQTEEIDWGEKAGKEIW